MRSEIVNGKKRIIITRSFSNEDKGKEVVLSIFGPDFYIPEKKAANK